MYVQFFLNKTINIYFFISFYKNFQKQLLTKDLMTKNYL